MGQAAFSMLKIFGASVHSLVPPGGGGVVHPWRSLTCLNPLNSELNPICHLLALLGAHHIFHVSRIRVNTTMFRSPANYSKTLDCTSRFDVCITSSQSFPYTVAQSKLVFQPKSFKPVAILKSLPAAALWITLPFCFKRDILFNAIFWPQDASCFMCLQYLQYW